MRIDRQLNHSASAERGGGGGGSGGAADGDKTEDIAAPFERRAATPSTRSLDAQSARRRNKGDSRARRKNPVGANEAPFAKPR